MIEVSIICVTVFVCVFFACKAAVDISMDRNTTTLELDEQSRRNSATLLDKVDFRNELEKITESLTLISGRVVALESRNQLLDETMQAMNAEITELKTKQNGESLKDGLKLK